MLQNEIIALEDKYLLPFAPKIPVAIDYGSGVDVWDVNGIHYLDFTSGWAVTSLGHADPVIINALDEQAKKIIHNPNAGCTYSPARSKLIGQLLRIVPRQLHHFYFVNSGAEANDLALKLARKVTGRKKVVSTNGSFHGRTIGTTSVTGQAIQRDRYSVVVPFCEFVNYNDIAAVEAMLDHDTAAVIVEPIQGEGGVRIPDATYLRELADLCRKNATLLIVDEIQTGFWRTGPSFMSLDNDIIPGFLTMGKGIAGGFPFAALAVADDVADKIEIGDHGGTYCGNPLGCAVAAAIIEHCLAIDIERSVRQAGALCNDRLTALQTRFPSEVKEVRGRGLLHAIEFIDVQVAESVQAYALQNGLILNLKHGTVMRICPALTVDTATLDDGLSILAQALYMAIETC